MSKNYYDILGVTKAASKDDIKKAFYKLARKYHPDSKGGNESKFKELNEAYQVLSDDIKRKEYDTYGQTFSGAGQGFGGYGGFDASDFSNMNFEFGDLGEMFGDMFSGAGFGGPRQKRGRDISIELDVTFNEAIFGTERKVLLTKLGVCKECAGSGAAKGTKKITCERCNGQGKVRETRKTFMGTFQTVRTCEACFGTGKVPEVKCHECHGRGIKEVREEVVITIPPGMNNGEMIRLSQMGEAVSGGVSGDLYVKVNVAPHKTWKRDGSDLVYTHSIKLTDALLGDTHHIEGIDGEIKLEIPAGVSAGEVLRIRGRGVPVGQDQSKRGDALIRLTIVMPKKLSKEASGLVEKLKKEGL